MKKKIVILGSTGSIGNKTLQIISKDKKNFDVIMLSTNSNIKILINQAKKFKVKHLIVSDKKAYQNIMRLKIAKKYNIYNNFRNFNKFIKKKVDYTMCAITGIEGLEPTLRIIQHTKKIAIANKESIICGWNLINYNLKKYKTKFIPIDSEHFSILSLINDSNDRDIEKIYITASGGPFLNYSKKKLNKIKPSNAIKHPSWKMGKKISVDSSTMINKVFEVIEAQRIFNISLNKFKILIHPKSYLHSIIKFNNGISKLLIHDTDMKIPIFNSIYNNKTIKCSQLNINNLNNLNLEKPNTKQFDSIKLLKLFSNKISLFETVLVSANDELVNNFLEGNISYLDIIKILKKILNLNEFIQLRHIRPKNLQQILNLNKYVRLKTNYLCIK